MPLPAELIRTPRAAPPRRPGAGLRVLLVVDSLAPGGAERHVVDLAGALRRRGHRVTVACAAGGPLLGELRRTGVGVEVVGPREVKRRFSAAYAGRLRRLVRARPFDLVHAHIYASAVAAAAALVGIGVPLVVTEHTEAPWRGPGARRASAWGYRRAAHLVAVSSAVERLLVAGYGVPADRISFVLPAVGPPPGVPATRRALGPGPLVARVARLAPEKGVDVFLRAAALLADSHPDAGFLVVGDGPLRHELAALAARLGVAGRVAFLGHRTDARALMAAVDVVAVSSRSDGSPLVVLEAMAAGVPVVAGAVGGIPDQLRHGGEGLLVAPGDPRALAAGLAALLDDPERARRLGEAGRRRARGLGHDAMVARLEAIYSGVLAPGRAERNFTAPRPAGASAAG